LEPDRAETYCFVADGQEVTVVLTFTPDVNKGSGFGILRFKISPNPGPDLNEWDKDKIGEGSFDGDRTIAGETGNLVWSSESLVKGTRYYVHFFNAGKEGIQYCLATDDVLLSSTCQE
jgi:hypothetical protein